MPTPTHACQLATGRPEYVTADITVSTMCACMCARMCARMCASCSPLVHGGGQLVVREAIVVLIVPQSIFVPGGAGGRSPQAGTFPTTRPAVTGCHV